MELSRINKPGLRWRIVTALLLVSLLPLILLSAGSWIVFSGILESKALDHMRTMVEGHAHAVEGYLNERVHLLQLLAESKRSWRYTDDATLAEHLSDLNRFSNGAFVDLGVIGEDGRHICYTGPFDLKNRVYKDADWLRSTVEEGIYISDVFLGYRNIPHCIIAIKIEEGGDFHIIRATVNSAQFDEIVRAGGLGETAESYIINRQGILQTSSDIGKPLPEYPLQFDTDFGNLKSQRLLIDGKRFIRVARRINDDRWVLLVQQEESAIRAPVNQALARISVFVFVSFLLVAVSTILATRHLTKKIDEADRMREETSRAFMRSAKLASIGELATGLAHEINNPLAIIAAEQTNITDIVNDPESEPDWKKSIIESVTRCKHQIRRCANITSKMLQFGRKSEPSPEPTDINAHLNEVINFMIRSAKIKNIKLNLEIEKNLPKVLVDPMELEQVTVNLIANSIDALPHGGEINIFVSNRDDFIIIGITDNGTGIPPEHLEHIFEPFFTTKPVGKGTGLGLSVCYGIVQSWGGNITVDSIEGKGTEMTVTIPINREITGEN
jgi:two-component system NtrC family sensor kinase